MDISKRAPKFMISHLISGVNCVRNISNKEIIYQTNRLNMSEIEKIHLCALHALCCSEDFQENQFSILQRREINHCSKQNNPPRSSEME